jgi:hypothetical protein
MIAKNAVILITQITAERCPPCPSRRTRSATGKPISARFTAATICSVAFRLFLTGLLLHVCAACLFLLLDSQGAPDIIAIQINPIVSNELANSVRDIINWLNETRFNSSLMKEHGAMALVVRLAE